MARQSYEGDGSPATSDLHPHVKIQSPFRTGTILGQGNDYLVIDDFLRQNYRHKSEGTLISCDAGWAPIPYNGRKFLPNLGAKKHLFLYYDFRAS